MPSTSDTKLVNFRLSANDRAALEELADYLDGSMTQAHVLAVYYMRERLGLTRRSAVALVESIAREHGDDAPIVVTVTDLAHGKGVVTIAGEERPELAVRVYPMVTGVMEDDEDYDAAKLLASGGTLYAHILATDVETGTAFDFGEIKGAEDGASLTVLARDLPEHVVHRDPDGKKSSKQLAAEFRMGLDLRRRLRAATGLDPDDSE
jgi:hypothetical protein